MDLNDEEVTVTAPRAVPSQSFRLAWRVDLSFRLIDDPQGPRCVIRGLQAISVTLDRNKPATADTAEIELQGSALPFDLGIIVPKSMSVAVWPYTHQEPWRCDYGDPGEFIGVVDEITRDRYTLRTTLQCRDRTAILLAHKLSEDDVKAFTISTSASIQDAVESIVRAVPGTRDWSFESRSKFGSSLAVSPPRIEPSKKAVGKKPYPKTSKLTAPLASLVPPGDLNAWTAVCNLCARAGVVPEIRSAKNGDPVVVLVDASDLQRSDVLRPFYRNKRNWRVFLDNAEVNRFEETMTLSGGAKRPDFVEVGSYNPGTGRRISARYPPAPARGGDGDEGVFDFVDGVVSEEALLRMARAYYEATAHNTFRVSLDIKEPWSSGGYNASPDLLWLGYGAVAEIAMPAFARVLLERPLDQILEAQGVSENLRARILRAQDLIDGLALLFQVESVRHQWTGGKSPGYTATVRLRRFVGTATMPIVDTSDARERGFA